MLPPALFIMCKFQMVLPAVLSLRFKKMWPIYGALLCICCQDSKRGGLCLLLGKFWVYGKNAGAHTLIKFDANSIGFSAGRISAVKTILKLIIPNVFPNKLILFPACYSSSGGRHVQNACTLCTLCTLFKTGRTTENKILGFSI
jgi:hypothetical protein